MFAIHRRRISASTLFATLPATDRAYAEIVPSKIDASVNGSEGRLSSSRTDDGFADPA